MLLHYQRLFNCAYRGWQWVIWFCFARTPQVAISQRLTPKGSSQLMCAIWQPVVHNKFPTATPTQPSKSRPQQQAVVHTRGWCPSPIDAISLAAPHVPHISTAHVAFFFLAIRSNRTKTNIRVLVLVLVLVRVWVMVLVAVIAVVNVSTSRRGRNRRSSPVPSSCLRPSWTVVVSATIRSFCYEWYAWDITHTMRFHSFSKLN